MYIYIYTHIQRGYAPFRRAWAVGFGTWEDTFWSHAGVFWGPSWGVWEVQVGGLGGFLRSMLDLLGHQWGFGRFKGYMEEVWKGLGWLRGGWGPGCGSNMDPT